MDADVNETNISVAKRRPSGLELVRACPKQIKKGCQNEQKLEDSSLACS